MGKFIKVSSSFSFLTTTSPRSRLHFHHLAISWVIKQAVPTKLITDSLKKISVCFTGNSNTEKKHLL